jgi:hypothetical protein
MLSRHNNPNVVLGDRMSDVYLLYVYMPYAISHILHHAQLVGQIGRLIASTAESRRCTFSSHVISMTSGSLFTASLSFAQRLFGTHLTCLVVRIQHRTSMTDCNYIGELSVPTNGELRGHSHI